LEREATHHVNILEMNGESYRLAQSRARKAETNNDSAPGCGVGTQLTGLFI